MPLEKVKGVSTGVAYVSGLLDALRNGQGDECDGGALSLRFLNAPTVSKGDLERIAAEVRKRRGVRAGTAPNMRV